MEETKVRIIEIVNLIGSIASLTGISLLWLKDNISFSLNLFWQIPIIFAAVFLILGYGAGIIYSIIRASKKKEYDNAMGYIAFWCFRLSLWVPLFMGISFAIGFLAFLLITAPNK